MSRLILPMSVLFSVLAFSQSASDKVSALVVGMDDAAPVANTLIRLMRESKPFTVANGSEASDIKILLKCSLLQSKGPITCAYIMHKTGLTFDSFLGGGITVAADAESASSFILGAIAQDIVERFNNTGKENLRKTLESCLLLTDSKCNVPAALQSEFKATQLTLGQFLLLKK